jgi:hypothetical protein
MVVGTLVSGGMVVFPLAAVVVSGFMAARRVRSANVIANLVVSRRKLQRVLFSLVLYIGSVTDRLSYGRVSACRRGVRLLERQFKAHCHM